MTTKTSLAGDGAQLTEQGRRIAALESKIRQLEIRNKTAGSTVVGRPAEQVSLLLENPKIGTVVQITESLFPEGTVEVESDADPSEPDYPFVVLGVKCGGAVEELIAKETEWGRRVRAAAPELCGPFRLLISPVE